MSEKGMGRRAFIKTAALAGVAAAGASVLAGCSESAGSSDTGKWDKEADIVIVGGGGTGFAAAVEGARGQNTVIVLEKANTTGGNTGLSAGMMLAAGTKLQKELAGVTDDSVELHYQQAIALAEGLGDEEVIKAVVYGMPDAIDFMVALGRSYGVVTALPRVRGFDTDDTWRPRIHWNGGDMGTSHMKPLTDEAAKLGVEVLTDTPVTSLVSDGANGVVGVVANSGGDEIRVKAKKGVILASGGIDYNLDMCKQYSPQQYHALVRKEGFNQVCRSNTGDGTRMAMAVGADLNTANMQGLVLSDAVASLGAFTYASNPSDGPITILYPLPGNIVVDRFGNRFCQDDAQWPHLNRQIFRKIQEYGDQDKLPSVFIVADSTAAAGWFVGMAGELDKSVDGTYYFKGDTIEGLAEAMGVTPANLRRTVDRWNEIQATQSDPDFGRYTDWGPIAQPPFYAARATPNIMGTGGGIKINADMQVIDVEGNPIPRLYAGGMTAGCWYGSSYPGCGYAVSGTVVMGRIAAQNAGANAAWA
jgi:urocanate reductase